MEPRGPVLMTELAELRLATLISRADVSLYLTTTRQITDRRSRIGVASARRVRAILDDWRLISLHRHDTNQVRVHLVGHVRGTHAIRVTSDVMKIDLAADLLITQNSVYALGTKGEAEPGLRQLMTIVHVFYAWGLGEVLGMPRILL